MPDTKENSFDESIWVTLLDFAQYIPFLHHHQHQQGSYMYIQTLSDALNPIHTHSLIIFANFNSLFSTFKTQSTIYVHIHTYTNRQYQKSNPSLNNWNTFTYGGLYVQSIHSILCCTDYTFCYEVQHIQRSQTFYVSTCILMTKIDVKSRILYLNEQCIHTRTI